VIDLRFVVPDLRRLDDVSAEVVACGVFRDQRPFTGLAGLLDWRLAGRLSKLAKQGFLVGEVGEVLALPARPRLHFDKVIVMGLGARATFNDAVFQKVTERLLAALAGLHVKKACVELPGRGAGAIEPERAAAILLDRIGDDERDALSFIEDAEGQRRFEKHAHDRRQKALRGMRASP
jgi:hypothetical protein